MRLHLAPVAAVDVGRQHHESGAACLVGGFCERDCFLRGESGDGRDDGSLLRGGVHVAKDGFLLGEGEGGGFAERTEGDDASAAIGEQPLHVAGHKVVIDLQVFVEAGCDCGHYAIPLHRVSVEFSGIGFVTAKVSAARADSGGDARLETEQGNSGGRTESARQLKRNSAAVPQMRPWQGPIPQRVWSLAARQVACWLRPAWRTSSQRQTTVSSAGRSLSRGSSAQACCSARTKPRLRWRLASQAPCGVELADRGQRGDAAFEDGQLDAADAGRFTGAVQAGNGGLQHGIGDHESASRCGTPAVRAAQYWAPGESHRPDNRSRRSIVSGPCGV